MRKHRHHLAINTEYHAEHAAGDARKNRSGTDENALNHANNDLPKFVHNGGFRLFFHLVLTFRGMLPAIESQLQHIILLFLCMKSKLSIYYSRLIGNTIDRDVTRLPLNRI